MLDCMDVVKMINIEGKRCGVTGGQEKPICNRFVAETVASEVH